MRNADHQLRVCCAWQREDLVLTTKHTQRSFSECCHEDAAQAIECCLIVDGMQDKYRQTKYA